MNAPVMDVTREGEDMKVNGQFASETGFVIGCPKGFPDYEKKLKESLHLTAEDRFDALYDKLANIAVLSGTIWGSSKFKQEALDEIHRIVKEAQCLC